MAHFQFGVIDN